MTSFFHENSIYSLLLQQQKNLLLIHDGNYGALKNMAPNVLQVNDVLDFAKKRVSRAGKIQNVAQPEAPKARSVYLLLYAGRILYFTARTL